MEGHMTEKKIIERTYYLVLSEEEMKHIKKVVGTYAICDMKGNGIDQDFHFQINSSLKEILNK